MFVALEDGIAYLRVVGRANFVTGADFKNVVDGLIAKGVMRFAVDLKECVLMDSTFIGLLAGYGMQLPAKGQQGVSLHNANDRVGPLFANLGVGHLFIPCPEDGSLPENRNEQAAESGDRSRDEVQRICLEAHRKLMEANPENVARFKDVARFLEEDLKRGAGGV
ncbi:MAG TPA: hypothetical protein DCY13_25160 [Verrucomicrobiales bacterium]|nr:hypothetical protein [Verrucomicrobiales bacterium]